MTRSIYRFFCLLLAGGVHALCASAQSFFTIDFEGSVPPGQEYLNGSEQPFGTTYNFSTPVGQVVFPNVFDTLYGGFWVQGWALSRRADSTTAAMSNAYGVKAYTGNGGSETYAVGLGMARLRTHLLTPGSRVKSFYLTNTTWNYEAMRQGLGASKIFGGPTGTDPDFFKLVVKRYVAGVLQSDSVELYLADFRFPGASSQDYILNTWTKLELNMPAPMDSLLFILRSSDVGLFGMNTPPYFAIDDVEVEGAPAAGFGGHSNEPEAVRILPDGAVMIHGLEAGKPFCIYDLSGRVCLSGSGTGPVHILSNEILPPGLYVLRMPRRSIGFVKP